jgi:hypothetical protein
MAYTRKQVVSYFILPQIKPRVKDLFISGFHYIPFFIALVYQLVRLLPANHPYTQSQNMGQFGIRHVIAEAANNLKFTRENFDQILVFGLILIGVVLAGVQVALFGLSLFSGQVFAQAMPTNFAGFFVTQDPQHDMAHMLMDLVFGIPDFFKSCVDANIGGCTDVSDELVQKSTDVGGGWILNEMGWPHPIHRAMHAMFQWYSFGLLVIGMMIGIYFVVTVIVETAQTGTPFGKRFNKVWAPIRFVVAFGLLIPVAHGLNGSQYVVLYAAKFGSGFATNGWNLFNDTLGTNMVLGDGSKTQLVSRPAAPKVAGLLQFLWTSRVCAETYNAVYNTDSNPDNDVHVYPYLVRGFQTVSSQLLIGDWTGNNPGAPTNDVSYEDMIAFAYGTSQVTLRFGELDEHKYPKAKGHVEPLCGEIIVPLSDPRSSMMPDPNDPDQQIPNTKNPPEPGAEYMQMHYWLATTEIWWNLGGFLGNTVGPEAARNVVKYYLDSDTNVILPNHEFVKEISTVYQWNFENDLDIAIDRQVNSGSWTSDELKKRGWGGAGIWYNKVSDMNGIVTSAVMNVPIVSHYPMIMEQIMENKVKQDGHVSVETRYKPDISGMDDNTTGLQKDDLDMADVMWEGFDLWQKAGFGQGSHTAATGILLYDIVNEFFGTSGLYRLKDNEGTHPLAMLVGMGRSLIEAAMKNLGFSIASATAGGILAVLDDLPIAGEGAQAASAAVSFLMTFVIIGLTIGFALYYVIPFMPFIYFFFALGGWVKGIFEAMVGAPLWALAHIRIDGEGLPGSAALNGYLLVFEIFLRPILIIFGILGSITTFSALVDVLNMTWTLVVKSVSGFDVEGELAGGGASEFLRGPLDDFFYTVVYAIIVYLLAMASFKMIDLIPNHILRWMGQSAESFGDTNENPTGSLMQMAGVGGQQTIQQLGGGVSGALQKVPGIAASMKGKGGG